MWKFIILICIILTTCDSSAIDRWNAMKVKWAPSRLFKDKYAFITIPDNVTYALANDWIQITLENQLNLTVLAREKAYDYGVNGLYDANGFLAGLHSCLPYESAISSIPDGYDILSNGQYELKTLDGTVSACTSFLIVSPETIKAGGRTTMVPYGDGLWVRDTTNNVTYFKEYPTNSTQLQLETYYDMKTCIFNMGSHYYQDPPGEQCIIGSNWFFLGKQSQEVIQGIGIVNYGYYYKYWTSWWDLINRQIVQFTNNDQADCWYSNVSKYGMYTMHIYFVEEPWNIDCVDGDE